MQIAAYHEENYVFILILIKLNGTSLEETFEYCDLGLVTSNTLSWNAHVARVTKFLVLLKDHAEGLKEINTLRTLYYALIRSQLRLRVVPLSFSPDCVERGAKETREKKNCRATYWMRDLARGHFFSRVWNCGGEKPQQQIDHAVNLILFCIRRNHNVCIYSFV